MFFVELKKYIVIKIFVICVVFILLFDKLCSLLNIVYLYR